MKLSSLLKVFINVACVYGISSTDISPFSNVDYLANSSNKEKSVSPCHACKNLVTSFLKGLEETTRLSFAGGDADWEREKLGNYENSELRFIEIQENLCSDLASGKDQCYNLAELKEAELEDWFYEKRNSLDLFTYLCVNHMKICCPDHTYGPHCAPCPGGIEEPCGGHGKCKNDGTREEPTKCLCDAGYTGDLCDECTKGYFKNLNSSKLLCEICDKACKDHCRGPGANNCEVCSEGYNFVQNEGCVAEDNDEEEQDENSLENVTNEAENSEFRLDPEVLSINNQQSDHQEL